jgi:hypothetical protein
MRVDISLLRGSEPHEALIPEVLKKYQRMIRDGLGLELIKVVQLPDGLYSIVDGHHRARALSLEGVREADVTLDLRGPHR